MVETLFYRKCIYCPMYNEIKTFKQYITTEKINYENTLVLHSFIYFPSNSMYKILKLICYWKKCTFRDSV